MHPSDRRAPRDPAPARFRALTEASRTTDEDR
jgi:hypothetical protein